MADVMAQQSLNLPPSSRRDIISALLDGYGNSFEGGDTSPYSPYKLSPVPALKELPPPPPSEMATEPKFSNDKPSSAVGLMSMRFQLRVDEPVSPESSNGSNSTEGSPTRIVSKRLKRRSIPRSLTLTKSNGSTAEVPAATTAASQPEALMLSEQIAADDEKSLPPPPPPEKSARRQQQVVDEITSFAQQPAMGNSSSKSRSPRKDSLHSQDGKGAAGSPTKRKLLPKFTSLAELGNGRRGGKGGPLPQPRARKQSVDGKPANKTDEERGRSLVRNEVTDAAPGSAQTSKPPVQNAPMQVPRAASPPTPKDDPAAAPPPPKKLFGGIGLPSNPKHKKGKSSTGFDIFKAATPPPTQQAPAPPPKTDTASPIPTTITPGPTSPNNPETMQEKIVDQEKKQPGLVPASLSLSNDQRRRFSFEPVSPPPPQITTSQEQSQLTTTPPSTSPVSPLTPAAAQAFVPPPRTTSRAPPAFASLPSQQRTNMSEDLDSRPITPEEPPFVPLTESPISLGPPSITEKHHGCYSKHATFVWSRNTFQPMACMVCKKNDQERKWACVWCYLRLCVDCSKELSNTPGRDLQAVLDKQAAKATYAGDDYFGEPGGEHVEPPAVNGGLEEGLDGKRHDSGNPSLVVWGADSGGIGNQMDFR